MKKTETVLSDEDLDALRRQNEGKAAAAIAKMGVRYACHPANVVRKDPAKANFAPDTYKAPRHVSAPVFLLNDKKVRK